MRRSSTSLILPVPWLGWRCLGWWCAGLGVHKIRFMIDVVGFWKVVIAVWTPFKNLCLMFHRNGRGMHTLTLPRRPHSSAEATPRAPDTWPPMTLPRRRSSSAVGTRPLPQRTVLIDDNNVPMGLSRRCRPPLQAPTLFFPSSGLLPGCNPVLITISVTQPRGREIEATTQSAEAASPVCGSSELGGSVPSYLEPSTCPFSPLELQRPSGSERDGKKIAHSILRGH